MTLTHWTDNREAALATGALVDVTATAKEAGFKVSVALTRAAWEDSVAWTNGPGVAMQDEAGRLWDVLWMSWLAARQAAKAEASVIQVAFYRVPVGGMDAVPHELHAWIHGGDAGEPVLTLMTAEELEALLEEY